MIAVSRVSVRHSIRELQRAKHDPERFNALCESLMTDEREAPRFDGPRMYYFNAAIRQALARHIVIFRFVKVTDGGFRFALGTLIPIFYAGYVFKGGFAPKIRGLVRYWDLGIGGKWRSFYTYNVQAFSILQ